MNFNTLKQAIFQQADFQLAITFDNSQSNETIKRLLYQVEQYMDKLQIVPSTKRKVFNALMELLPVSIRTSPPITWFTAIKFCLFDDTLYLYLRQNPIDANRALKTQQEIELFSKLDRTTLKMLYRETIKSKKSAQPVTYDYNLINLCRKTCDIFCKVSPLNTEFKELEWVAGFRPKKAKSGK